MQHSFDTPRGPFGPITPSRIAALKPADGRGGERRGGFGLLRSPMMRRKRARETDPRPCAREAVLRYMLKSIEPLWRTRNPERDGICGSALAAVAKDAWVFDGIEPATMLWIMNLSPQSGAKGIRPAIRK
jgi:hypothetical protein